ncbi:hypothetical protein, partial [Noviherbaspirillum pedocola]|uniref:hypothetical protein n=1 Tax=Noviherbaspirillum pedocola TaxID=2801341 RepID=UPI001F3A7741
GSLTAPTDKLRPPQTNFIPWPPEQSTLRAFAHANFLIATEPHFVHIQADSACPRLSVGIEFANWRVYRGIIQCTVGPRRACRLTVQTYLQK